MAYTESFLNDLRDRLLVSEVVGRTMKLRKEGSELRAIEDKSLTVNDQKALWWDHSADIGGSIFDWFIKKEGRTFLEAVEICAELAGVPLPNRPAPTAQANGRAKPATGPQMDDIPFADPSAYGDVTTAPSAPASPREITRTYDYTDATGQLVYQVCRLEWEEAGRKTKTFMQRRPDGQGHWIWGLSSGDFLQARNGDWYQATKDRVAKWKGAKRRTFPDGVEHGLYRLVDFREQASADDFVFLPEGEKDVDTIFDWGLVASTNSGGAKNWRETHAEEFRGRRVVIPVDNDDAGRQRGEKIAESLWGKAESIRLLDFAEIWPGAPKGADVTDWKKQREGDGDDLRALVDKLPEWRPKAFVPKYRGVRFENLDMAGVEHSYAIDEWLTEGGKAVIGGASLSGKSFLAIHMAMCIATGLPFFGYKVLLPGLVVYQAGEGESGVRKRFRAWRDYFGVARNSSVPVYIIEQKVDLFSPSADTQPLIDEIRGVARTYNVPLRAIFIDTLAKASIGADENSGRDMGLVMSNIDRIADEFPNANSCLVHHMNANGTKLRGHTSVYANVDQVVLVSREEDSKVRTAVLDKQKDGESGLKIPFELHQVEVGRRQIDGKPITSCVCLPAGGQHTVRTEGSGSSRDRTATLSAEDTLIYQALQNAIEEHGETPSPMLKLPKAITKVVHAKHWKEAYMAKASDLKDNTVNQRLGRASTRFQNMRIMGRINPFVWLTKRDVATAPMPDQGSVSAGPAIQRDFTDQTDFAPR